ncbi:hypothetical protein PQ766_09115, partial [Staphylococcus aureus]|nr:hypothetical protein [Staphylococcus aureus]
CTVKGLLYGLFTFTQLYGLYLELEHIDVLITSKDFGFDEILFYTLYLLLILIILYYLKKQVKTKS